MTQDYAAAGIPLDRPGVRIARLAEAITIVKGLMADEPFTFTGTHYQVSGLDGRPQPVQRPHPPILIGGGGPRVLALAAREADIVGVNMALASGRIDESAGPSSTAAATDDKIAWIREAAGERFDAIELHVRIHLTAISDDRRGLAEAVSPAFGMTAEEGLASPHALVGTVDEIIETLQARRERWGLSYIGLSVDAMDAMAPVVAKLAGT
jgi:probable F420-dependent oxidoreductase